MIAVELGARYPDLPSALVLVDPGPIDPRPETAEFFRGFAGRLEGPDGEAVRREYVADMGARDEELARWIVDHMCAVPQRVAAAVIRGVGEWNGRDPLASCTAPVLLLRTGLWAETDVLRLLAIKPDLRGRDHRRRRPLPPARGARAGERHDRALPRVVTLNR